MLSNDLVLPRGNLSWCILHATLKNDISTLLWQKSFWTLEKQKSATSTGTSDTAVSHYFDAHCQKLHNFHQLNFSAATKCIILWTNIIIPTFFQHIFRTISPSFRGFWVQIFFEIFLKVSSFDFLLALCNNFKALLFFCTILFTF